MCGIQVKRLPSSVLFSEDLPFKGKHFNICVGPASLRKPGLLYKCDREMSKLSQPYSVATWGRRRPLVPLPRTIRPCLPTTIFSGRFPGSPSIVMGTVRIVTSSMMEESSSFRTGGKRGSPVAAATAASSIASRRGITDRESRYTREVPPLW